jgi:hypothetical protein
MFELTNLQLHLIVMALMIAGGLSLILQCKRMNIIAMYVILGSLGGCFVVAVNALRSNTDYDLAKAILRSELYGAALGEHNLVIQNREYRMTRVPRDEDDLDNDEVDLDPEIPV